MKVKLWRMASKGRVDEVVLRHMGTTISDSGEELEWFSLADDPSGAKWPMTRQQVVQYDWERLRYIGSWPNEMGQPKHWFKSLDGM